MTFHEKLTNKINNLKKELKTYEELRNKMIVESLKKMNKDATQFKFSYRDLAKTFDLSPSAIKKIAEENNLKRKTTLDLGNIEFSIIDSNGNLSTVLCDNLSVVLFKKNILLNCSKRTDLYFYKLVKGNNFKIILKYENKVLIGGGNFNICKNSIKTSSFSFSIKTLTENTLI